MIRNIEIKNFKSIRDLELDLGIVTVLIGANGSGKSNILEAISFASAASADKLDNEFFVSRGIRTAEDPRAFLSMFEKLGNLIHISLSPDGDKGIVCRIILSDSGKTERWEYLAFEFDLAPKQGGAGKIFVKESKGYSRSLKQIEEFDSSSRFLRDADDETRSLIKKLGEELNKNRVEDSVEQGEISDFVERFLIYAPENRELRTFAEEGQILPLGIRGEGLFRLLKILAQQDNGAKLAILKEKLQLIDWFEDFEFQQDAMAYERRLLIRDRHLSGDLAYFDQRSANEGFLFLLFYFCLFLSDATPPFFAIDNIDSSLNPKLCERLMLELVKMAKDNGKQVILTTHNPAILDGLDLNYDEQRLYTVRRNRKGETIAERICAPKVTEGQRPIRLSDAYLRGLLGGLPTNF